MKSLLLSALALLAASAHAQFALRDGDRVVFYGDSITDQRLYTLFTEAFVRTRYPQLKVDFTHSGWSSDRVSGGPGGTIDARLARDVFPYRPTVMTIMLGMNDGGNQAFNPGLYETFRKGYDHVLTSVRAREPGVRFTLIQSSPYDDVTRPVTFPGGYNATLVRFGEAVRQEAETVHATIADFNAPVVAMLAKANATNPASAQRFLVDRVHPSAAAHLVMMEALLKAWNADPMVCAVEIRGAMKLPVTSKTTLTDLRAEGGGWI